MVPGWLMVAWKSLSPVPCRDEESYFPLTTQKSRHRLASRRLVSSRLPGTHKPVALMLNGRRWPRSQGRWKSKSHHVFMMPSMTDGGRLNADAASSFRFHGIFVSCEMHRLTPSSLAAPPHRHTSLIYPAAPDGLRQRPVSSRMMARPEPWGDPHFDIADPHYHAHVDIKHVVSMAKSPT